MKKRLIALGMAVVMLVTVLTGCSFNASDFTITSEIVGKMATVNFTINDISIASDTSIPTQIAVFYAVEDNEIASLTDLATNTFLWGGNEAVLNAYQTAYPERVKTKTITQAAFDAFKVSSDTTWTDTISFSIPDDISGKEVHFLGAIYGSDFAFEACEDGACTSNHIMVTAEPDEHSNFNLFSLIGTYWTAKYICEKVSEMAALPYFAPLMKLAVPTAVMAVIGHALCHMGAPK